MRGSRGLRWIAAAVVAVVVLVGAAVVVKRWHQHRFLASQCSKVTQVNQQRHDNDPVSRGGGTAVILGDSYAQGYTLANPRAEAWSTLLGRQEHWTTYVNGVGDTGFVNGGFCGHQEFASRVRAVLAYHPQIVVVQGGLNDQDTVSEVPEAARALLAALRSVPRVIVVGPPPAPAESPTALRQIDAALASAAAAAHDRYVSMLDARLAYGPDHLHATAASQPAFAQDVARQIR